MVYYTGVNLCWDCFKFFVKTKSMASARSGIVLPKSDEHDPAIAVWNSWYDAMMHCVSDGDERMSCLHDNSLIGTPSSNSVRQSSRPALVSLHSSKLSCTRQSTNPAISCAIATIHVNTTDEGGPDGGRVGGDIDVGGIGGGDGRQTTPPHLAVQWSGFELHHGPKFTAVLSLHQSGPFVNGGQPHSLL